MKHLHPQQPLSFPLNQHFRLDNYLAGDNQQLIAELQQLTEPASGPFNYLYLWGESGVGCSHLLQAVCQVAVEQGLTAMYLPLRDVKDYGPEVLDNLESFDLVCLDDVDAIATLADWEEALFHLFNRLQGAAGSLLVAAHNPPAYLGVGLSDIGSRLASGAVYQVQGLSDQGQLDLLQQRAALKSMELPAEVANFILGRSNRDNAALCSVMDKLDTASMAAQRKLTIPFVKQVMGW